MKERPILFNAPMVKAILEGRKTQTRRVVKLKGDGYGPADAIVPAGKGSWIAWWGTRSQSEYKALTMRIYKPGCGFMCPHGKPGDRLWVRETWALPRAYDPYKPSRIGKSAAPDVIYRSTHRRNDSSNVADDLRWRPSIHMPRWASRIDLEITDVRVERVQDVSGYDARDEGVNHYDDECSWCHGGGFVSSSIDILQPECPCKYEGGAKRNLAKLWDKINAKRGHSWDSNPWVWVVEFRVVAIKGVRITLGVGE